MATKPCLHCAIAKAIVRWADEHMPDEGLEGNPDNELFGLILNASANIIADTLALVESKQERSDLQKEIATVVAEFTAKRATNSAFVERREAHAARATGHGPSTTKH